MGIDPKLQLRLLGLQSLMEKYSSITGAAERPLRRRRIAKAWPIDVTAMFVKLSAERERMAGYGQRLEKLSKVWLRLC
jgi:hypothetical protein